MKTIVCICVCVFLGLFLPEMASAGGKHKGGGGGKAARAGGGGGGGKAARAGGAAKAAHIGGGGKAGAHLGKGAGQTGHAQHGLNAHQGARRGLNARAGSWKGNHAGKFSGNRAINNRLIGRNHLAAHWRSGLRWRNHHALYAGYRRAWHDHWWWRTHYNSVLFVGGAYWGGHWYWDGGYWFPAWGYNPVFVGYVYDGPIFAYANLPPDQVVINIQEALQDQGYYAGDVDGQLGTRTRDALAAYQRDNSLEVTAAIDEPTVQSLGLANAEA